MGLHLYITCENEQFDFASLCDLSGNNKSCCCSVYLPVMNYMYVTLACFPSVKYIYMLFAGQEVRVVKICDRGLENAARHKRTASVCVKT